MAKVLYEKRNGIGYITLNRPDALNALDDELNNELWTVWNDFATDQSVYVAILTGAGKAFCSGADLKTFIPKWEKANMLDIRRNVPTGIAGGITRGQHRITKPIIAAVNGHVLGVVSSWPSPATFVSLPKRPNSAYSKFATDFTKAMAVLLGLLRSLGLQPLWNLRLQDVKSLRKKHIGYASSPGSCRTTT
jgi:hypothetical protein